MTEYRRRIDSTDAYLTSPATAADIAERFGGVVNDDGDLLVPLWSSTEPLPIPWDVYIYRSGTDIVIARRDQFEAQWEVAPDGPRLRDVVTQMQVDRSTDAQNIAAAQQAAAAAKDAADAARDAVASLAARLKILGIRL